MERERIRLGAGISIFRERRSWLLDLNLGAGRIRKSLKTTSKWEALQWVVWMQPDGKPPIPSNERFKPADTPMLFQRPVPVINVVKLGEVRCVGPGISIEDACGKYLEYLAKTKSDSPDHIKNVGSQIRMFAKSAKIDRVQQIEARHIIDWLNSFAEKTAGTRKQKLWILRTWLNWCITMKYITSNPSEGIATPRVKRGKVKYLSFDEVHELLKASAGTPFEHIIKVAVYSGMRLDEILVIEPTDVDLKARWLNLGDTKTDRPRDIPLLDQAVAAFEAFVKNGGFGFVECGNTRDNLKAVFAAAKISGTDKFKLLRRTFVTHALLNEIDPYVVARWSGHDINVQQKNYAGYRRSDRPLEFTWCGKRIPRSGRLDPHGDEGDKQGSP